MGVPEPFIASKVRQDLIGPSTLPRVTSCQRIPSSFGGVAIWILRLRHSGVFYQSTLSVRKPAIGERRSPPGFARRYRSVISGPLPVQRHIFAKRSEHFLQSATRARHGADDCQTRSCRTGTQQSAAGRVAEIGGSSIGKRRRFSSRGRIRRSRSGDCRQPSVARRGGAGIGSPRTLCGGSSHGVDSDMDHDLGFGRQPRPPMGNPAIGNVGESYGPDQRFPRQVADQCHGWKETG